MHLPQRRVLLTIRVESANHVVLGRHEHDSVRNASGHNLGNIQKLCMHLAIEVISE